MMVEHMVSAHIRSRTSSIQEASDLQVSVAAAYRAYKGLKAEQAHSATAA